MSCDHVRHALTCDDTAASAAHAMIAAIGRRGN